MIDKLTKEQEAAMEVYAKKWIDVGTNTDRLDYDDTVRIVNRFQKTILATPETPVVIFDNPIEAWVGVCYTYYNVPVDELKDRVHKYFTEGDDTVDIAKPTYPYQDGSFYAPIISYYDYFFEELGITIADDLREKFDAWAETTKLGLIYPLENVCIVSEKPTSIHLNDEGQLHREDGPAIEYAGFGDFNVYSLNGVSVPEWLVMTSEGELDLNKYNRIENADVRTEFVRKFGIERMLDGFGKQLDTYENYDHEWWTKSEYELWDMSKVFDGVNYAPHLKMLNQTTKVWHVEAVSPNCQTLQEAIKERFGGQDFTIAAIA